MQSLLESDSIYRQKFERIKRESELKQKKLQQEIEEERDQFDVNKKTLERKVQCHVTLKLNN